MKYGLLAAIAFGFVALMSGTTFAGVATSGVTKLTAPAAPIVQEAGWRSRCYRRCRNHGHSRRYCRRKCNWWGW
jgi:hypothetical protein